MQDRALTEIAALQSGVVSLGQAISCGWSRDTIRSKVRSRRWQRVHRGVFALFTGRLDRTSRLWAAVLACGEGAVLSHQTAAEIHRLVDRPEPFIHVTIPRERRIRQPAGLVIHRSDRLRGRSFPRGTLPRTFVEETVLDLIQCASGLDEVCGWITRAFGRRLTSAGALRAAMALRQKIRWRNDLDVLISVAADGTHSVLEHGYDRDVEHAHGLPASTRQSPYIKSSGTRGFRDRRYRDFGVIIELDGKATHPDEDRWRDSDRDNAAAAAGMQSLRYGWRHVRLQPCDTALQVGQVLRLRGWAGQPKPCSPGCAVSEAVAERRSPAGAGR